MKWFYLFFGIASAMFFLESGSAFGFTTTSTVNVTSQAALSQSNFRWYENGDTLTPTSSLANENSAISTPAIGTVVRLRMNLLAGQTLSSGLVFRLQYSNSTSSGFTDVSATSSWIFYDNPGVADGQIIATTLLSNSNVGESYGESNPSAASPNGIFTGQYGEWDWAIENVSANTTQSWYFRMIYSSGTLLDAYAGFPSFTAVVVATTTPTSTPPGGGSTGGGGGLIFPRPSFPGEPEEPPKPRPESPCDNISLQRVDLSGDCRVDLIDLSILLYYYEDTGLAISRYDFNRNGEVDFPDVSVLMFYWTK